MAQYLLNILNIFWNQTANFSVKGQNPEDINTQRGVRGEGCLLFPLQFNIDSEEIVKVIWFRAAVLKVGSIL